MKKILCIIVAMVTLLSLVACSDSTGDSGTDTEADAYVHTVHDTGSAECSVCGLNYYDELRNIILEHGEQTLASYQNFVEYKFIDGGYIYSFCAWKGDADTFELRIRDMWDDVDEGFTLIVSPDSIEYNEYAWSYTWDMVITSSSYDYKKIKGTLDSTSVSTVTSSLTVGSTYGSASSSQASSKSSTACSLFKKILTYGLPHTLELGDEDISQKHFGFEKFK